MTRQRMLAVAGVVALLAAAPWVLDTYLISLGSRVLALGLLAVSVLMLTGTAGLASLGQAAYFGVGGYAAAIVGREVTDIGVVQLAVGAVVSAAVAAVIGLAAVRTRGVVFLMLTLAVAELAYSVATQWHAVTGGSDGLGGVPPVVPFWGAPALRLDGLVYLWLLAVVLLVVGGVAMLIRSPFGFAVSGIRQSEERVRAVGYPIGRYLLAWYVASGAVAGVAGVLWVHSQRFISPADVGLDVSALALMAVVIGGTRAIWGALAGTALMVLLRDWVASFAGPLDAHGPLLLGIAFLLAVYTLPGGLAGIPGRWRGRTVPVEATR